MTRSFDAEKTAKFFNQEFAPLEQGLMKDTELRERDQMFLASIKHFQPKSLKILDFGCGQGRLLTHLLRNGHEATGVEKHEGMRDYALASAESVGVRDAVLKGGVEVLKTLPSAHYDVVVMMGVLQYLSPEDFRIAISESKRILKPNGVYYATFQNELFDLFTFNKYTADFFANSLCWAHDENDRREVEAAIKTLVTNPEAPAYNASRARDNVFVRLTNPLSLAAVMRRDFGIHLRNIGFYEWFGLPPVLASTHGELSKRIAERAKKSADPHSWEGNFMANAFLASFDVTEPKPDHHRL